MRLKQAEKRVIPGIFGALIAYAEYFAEQMPIAANASWLARLKAGERVNVPRDELAGALAYVDHPYERGVAGADPGSWFRVGPDDRVTLVD